MPETPEELYERAKDGLRMPPVEEWDTFPFAGDMRPRPLEPPTEIDRPRLGAGGVDCSRCAATDDRFLWTDEHWRVFALPPSGLPLVAMLESREHYAEPGDLPDDLAAELGVMLARIERAPADRELRRDLGRHPPTAPRRLVAGERRGVQGRARVTHDPTG